MSELRDLSDEKHFKTFIYNLDQQLKENPEPTRQQLAHLVAKSLGARSLEAYWNDIEESNAAKTRSIESTGFNPDDPSHQAIAKTLDNLWMLASFKDFRLGLLDDDMEGLTFYTEVQRDLFINSFDEVRVKSEYLGDEKYQPKKLVEYQPDFKEDFYLTAAQLKAKYDARVPDNHSWSQYPYLGLERDSYQQEAGAGDTQLGYWDWVANQLEIFLDEVDC